MRTVIVIPTYNEADNIPSLIGEILDTTTIADVLIVDDILDTGSTLQKLVGVLRAMKPASLRTCILLDKEGRRTKTYRASYSGFTIPEAFVVGYGLDFAERYRNLPCIGVLRPELQNPPEWC